MKSLQILKETEMKIDILGHNCDDRVVKLVFAKICWTVWQKYVRRVIIFRRNVPIICKKKINARSPHGIILIMPSQILPPLWLVLELKTTTDCSK